MVTEFFTLGVDKLVLNIGKAGDQVVQPCWAGFAEDCSWQIVRVSGLGPKVRPASYS